MDLTHPSAPCLPDADSHRTQDMEPLATGERNPPLVGPDAGGASERAHGDPSASHSLRRDAEARAGHGCSPEDARERALSPAGCVGGDCVSRGEGCGRADRRGADGEVVAGGDVSALRANAVSNFSTCSFDEQGVKSEFLSKMRRLAPAPSRALDVSTLHYGDNLEVLRNKRNFPDESVDLVYLDPPFNSNRDYAVLFRESDGSDSEAEIQAFEDTWHWNDSARKAYAELTDESAESRGIPARLVTLIEAMHSFLDENDVMAYLVMMAVRLVELRRVLKRTGTLYLHCDPTASHYLKLVLDAIFGVDRFLSEIVWKRSSPHGNVGKNFGAVTDSILMYSKSEEYTWNQQHRQFEQDYIEQRFTAKDPDGRRWQSVTLRNPSPRPNLHYNYTASNGVTYEPHPNGWSCDVVRMRTYDREKRLHYPAKPDGKLRLKMYLDESQGVKLQNLWEDIPPVNSQADERTPYPTQKPVALLERILRTSSNPGDVVLDPFCGCGTTIDAAQRLGREWIGIDVTHLAIALIRNRLDTRFPGVTYTVVGEPEDEASAYHLAATDPFGFQAWSAQLIGAFPVATAADGKAKRGRDRGLDGLIRFRWHPEQPAERVIVQVKGGRNVGPTDVRDLRGTIEREKAPIGVLVTVVPPTKEMEREASSAGSWSPPGWADAFPRIQIITVGEAFRGKRVLRPGLIAEHTGAESTFKPSPVEGTLVLPGLEAPAIGRRRKK